MWLQELLCLLQLRAEDGQVFDAARLVLLLWSLREQALLLDLLLQALLPHQAAVAAAGCRGYLLLLLLQVCRSLVQPLLPSLLL
jgi:hypothetical protein